jgi:uracil-DNA glycosylase
MNNKAYVSLKIIMKSVDMAAREINSLKSLRLAEAKCERCPLYKHATQVVPGEGPAAARLMFVGEQPGDKEDIDGHPFVGPAGAILDKAIVEAGIDRKQVFVTNAVKHFKFVQRGKRRLHKKPNAYEIDRCNWWLERERSIVKPQVIVAMGATAVRGVLGKPAAINKIRGRLLPLSGGEHMIATVHPSYLLRIPDRADRHAQYRAFVRDLKNCHKPLEA